MKKFVLTFCVCLGCFSFSNAQSTDEKIAEAMNNSDWFALDSLYQTEPKDSISEFLEIFSRCLIGNRLNRPDVSIPAFAELFNTQSENLDLGNLLNSSMMFAMDLSRIGDNKTAAKMLSSTLSSIRTHLDSTTIAGVQQYINQYDFDTGAGVNIISDSLAHKYNLIPLDASTTVGGVDIQNGSYAIARELKIGDIIVRDVPFYVINITTNNEEADKYVDCFNIVVGSELMLQLKDLTIDFVNNKIIVPSIAPKRSQVSPNMCFSSQMNLLGKGIVKGDKMLMNIDTGDASYGSLGKGFFENNKENITTHCKLDTIRNAGIGGVNISECYRVPNLSIELGNNEIKATEMVVVLKENMGGTFGYECNLGLKSLMLFSKVRFNLVDFVLTTSK